MTSKKLVTWTVPDGSIREAHIEVTRELTDDIADLDGHKLNMGKKLYESLNIQVYANGKCLISSRQEPSVVIGSRFFGKDFIKQVESMDGYAVLGNKMVITEDTYNKIMAVISEATAETNSEEIAAEVEEEKAIEEAEKSEETVKNETLKTTPIPKPAIEAYNHY